MMLLSVNNLDSNKKWSNCLWRMPKSLRNKKRIKRRRRRKIRRRRRRRRRRRGI
jgi:hypothetical protein